MFSDINQVITNLTIKQKRDLVKTLKAVIKEDLQDARNAKVSAKVAKQKALDSKRLDAIAKAEAKIAKLKTLVMRAV
jgi:gamma-glutamyl phosphate reductase